MYQLSCIDWWDDFNCYCVVTTPFLPIASGEKSGEVSVSGSVISGEAKETKAKDFIDTLAIKHAHYIYFSKNKQTSNESIVLY